MCGIQQEKPAGWSDMPTNTFDVGAECDDGPDIGMIIGIVVGSLVIIGGVVYFLKKKK